MLSREWRVCYFDFALEVTHKLRAEEPSNKNTVTDISLSSPGSTGAVNQVGNIYHC